MESYSFSYSYDNANGDEGIEDSDSIQIRLSFNDGQGELITYHDVADKFEDFLNRVFGYPLKVTVESVKDRG